ncbi:glycoside hydrolase family 3 N-terminal domain-containing protein [Kitasatospora sp. MBT63]|uniref:glycoside hydrolase family 3 N-terminal domain-containing protein n=1 Tax=Kitasatospora sp. MBT63 TaxID=1444768 RepID=UPI000539621E|nr:glycoside hydrolase family 3 N-terminal domain-containing protein [Kitasatospora sp. MBT63]
MPSRAPVVAAGLVLLLAACSSTSGTAAGPSPAGSSATPSAPPTAAASPSPSPSPSPTPSPSPPASPTPSPTPTAAQLSADQLAGRRVVYSYPGLTPPESLLRVIREGRAAGVVFFGENVSSSAQLKAVVDQLRAAQRQSPVKEPLLLMTDQEGGLIKRLPGAPVPSAKEIGHSAAPSAAAATAGTGAGKNLTGLGLNANLAPVLDVYYTPGNFIDSKQRSYSSNPRTVATLGSAFITAQQKAGAAATAKHFPGLGSAPAGQDTDAGPVTLPVPLTKLRTVDEVPFQAAVTAGVQMVMLSWAVYPALDPQRPAGLSSAAVQELRGRLGYRGVTVTDAIEAGALKPFGTTGQRSVAAAAAGMDLLLCSARDTAQGQQAADALAAALDAGTLDRAEFTAAADRVTALRAALH